MAFISGYKFDNKHMANQAMSYLNTQHGLPFNGGLTMFSEVSYTQHEDGFYYIVFDSEWTSTLGDSIEIEIKDLPTAEYVPPIIKELPEAEYVPPLPPPLLPIK